MFTIGETSHLWGIYVGKVDRKPTPQTRRRKFVTGLSRPHSFSRFARAP